MMGVEMLYVKAPIDVLGDVVLYVKAGIDVICFLNLFFLSLKQSQAEACSPSCSSELKVL